VRANPPEFEVAPVVSDIEAINRERVEMNIEIQGIPEPLHECDAATLSQMVRSGSSGMKVKLLDAVSSGGGRTGCR